MKIVLTICVLAAALAVAQPIEFEVASIKPFELAPGPAGMLIGPGMRDGFFHARTSLLELLCAAYGVGEQQIQGPSWLNDDYFEIGAKVPAGIPNKDPFKPSDPNMEKMLQALLQSRFSLSVHTEGRESSVYDLVVAKSGIKMTKYPDQHDEGHGPPIKGAAGMYGTVTMPILAMQLSSHAGRLVIDKTGLDGKYNLELHFAPASPGINAQDVDAPILTDAVEQQLGLKLQPAKQQLPVIVIDHIEKTPTEN